MPRKPQPRDPNLDHPAVKLYIDICRSTPNHFQRALIAATVTQFDVYEAVLRKFMSEGRPPQRVDWTLERYGRTTADRGQPTVGGQPSAVVEPESELWSKALAVIKRELPGETFETWFGPIRFEGIDETQRLIRLRAPNQVLRDWVRVNYANLMDQACDEVGLSDFSIVWVLPETKSAGGAV